MLVLDASRAMGTPIDGGSRTPKHMLQLAGGGILFLAGAVLVLRKGSA